MARVGQSIHANKEVCRRDVPLFRWSRPSAICVPKRNAPQAYSAARHKDEDYALPYPCNCKVIGPAEATTSNSREFGVDLMDWRPIIRAPFEHDLELAVIIPGAPSTSRFPCRRTFDGRLNARTRSGWTSTRHMARLAISLMG